MSWLWLLLLAMVVVAVVPARRLVAASCEGADGDEEEDE
jgi:hypothetical protein